MSREIAFIVGIILGIIGFIIYFSLERKVGNV